ncbi:hypothetical protein HID58_079313 [Brassica napus]|uniref:Uncharacterized protein n=2 Tax=Brassica napus TaxID=3708 RepID=A0ABQ7Y1N8_BRANA|nr:hypothetical protein HID58_079313 [Brassica napus]
MVMCGEWVCGNGGKWDFVLDKRQIGRLVPLYKGMSLRELKGNVLREFGVDEGLFAASLSYWPPSSLELATGIRTPPVILTSDGAIRFFLQHLRVKGAMNLFVGFVRNSPDKDEYIDDSGMGFVTPIPMKPKGPLNVGIGSSRRSFVSSKAPKPPIVNLEDVEFVREVERVEEEIKGGSAFGKEPTLSGSSLGEDYVVDEVDDRDVRPRGYDQEFWSPLLHGDFAGSNPVNVIYNEDEIVENLTKKSGPYRYTCTTNDAFDHVVEVGGTSNVKTDYGGDKHPEEDGVVPPVTKIQPGRRRKTRIPSVGEFSVTKKTTLVPNKCGRFRMEGHNRSSCTNPI